MKVCYRDFLILCILLVCWVGGLIFCTVKEDTQLFTAFMAAPGHLLISIGYYAVCNVCYSILFISDCKNEYQELIDNIKEGQQFFESKKIKYN